ncbi:serine/threonine protein kinase [Chthoniobacter flavus Ellin428]|uniref:non-specific serine/threonine protein kinase n=2 Tax=Chthoniobacter flavus TaxID=191863 RepID=B4D2I7_9BACT|nr:serine/threonine protein kinase [Chthoniobacter flavus Ellin428]
MEYVEGESARARLQSAGRIEPQEAITIAICVATALQYGSRKASLIHRDIKPDNIFLARSGEVKLGDLGLAKSAADNQGLTSTGHSLGTLYYISPEQARDSKTVDFRADIYSLGCTLFEMVSGRPPFTGSNAAAILLKHLTEPVPSLQAAWSQCPPGLSDLVGKMMQKDPGDRPQDYATLISELRHAYAMPAEPAPAPPPVRTARAEAGPAAGPAASPPVQPGSNEVGRATYVIDLDLEASAAPAPASARAAQPPIQPGPTPDCETLPETRSEPPPVTTTEVDQDTLPVQPRPPTAAAPASAPQSQPVDVSDLRLVTPIELHRETSPSASSLFIPPATPARQSPDAAPTRKSLPWGKIILVLLFLATGWFYLTHRSPTPSAFDTEDSADSPNPNSVWRDWVLESHRNGYFLYNREFADHTVGNHTEVVFQKRASANSQDTFRNGKIRVRCVIPPPKLPAQYVQFYVRMAPDAKGVLRRYEAYITHDAVVFALNDSAQGVHEITHWPVPATPDRPLDIVMEIEARNNTFTVSLNRMVVGTVRDDTIPGAGTFGLDGPAETRLSTLAFLNLDPPALPIPFPVTK